MNVLTTWLPIFSKFNLFSNEETFVEGKLQKRIEAPSLSVEKNEVRTVSGSTERKIIRRDHPLTTSCCKIEPCVLVHGGAGNIPDEIVPQKLNCVKKAAVAGFRVLREGGTSVEAVEAAIRVMEDDPVMNAGYGSVLNYEGEVEVDACIMVGETLEAGGVAAVQDIGNPISLAKLVMEKTPYTLITGTGAQKFATKNRFPLSEPGSLVTLAAKEALAAFKDDPTEDHDLEVWDRKAKEIETESVGAVAIDHRGRIAAGASSGGWNGRNRGKFNEACSVGGGVYADDEMGGVSLSGHGKYMVRMLLAFEIAKTMEKGRTALKSSKQWFKLMEDRFHELAGGTAISKYGDIAVYFNTPRMPWAYQQKNILYYGINPDEIEMDLAC